MLFQKFEDFKELGNPILKIWFDSTEEIRYNSIIWKNFSNFEGWNKLTSIWNNMTCFQSDKWSTSAVVKISFCKGNAVNRVLADGAYVTGYWLLPPSDRSPSAKTPLDSIGFQNELILKVY